MNHRTLTPRRRSNLRAYVAAIISYLMLVGQLTPLALASNPAARRAPAAAATAQGLEAAAAPAPPAAALVPSISATKIDSFADPDNDGKAAPGAEITYEVAIANSGTDASNVQFSDTIDANTTLVPGSVTMSPLARNDAYSTTQNTQLVVAAPGVLGNDSGLPAPAATAIAAGTTAQGGTVTLNADGSFTYTPATGFQGSDSFTYTATNTSPETDTATVTITIDAAPTVSSTTPTNGATQVANNANISITFSEAVNVTGNWFQIVCGTSGTRNVADTVVTGGPTTFTVNPNADFANGETCTVTVNAAQVTDQDSNDPPDQMAANFVFSFTTDEAPTVSSTTPTNGATNATTTTDISITFSEPVNVSGNWFQIVCSTSGTRNVADTVVTGGPTTFTVNPNADFAAGDSCTVTVNAAQVADQDSGDPPDNMAANYVFSFSVDAAPTVTATTPANGATQVANNTNVTVTFSEPVNVTGEWFSFNCATSGVLNVAAFSVTGGPTTYTLDKTTDYANGELCTVTINAAQVADQDGNDPPDNMAANYVFSFTIDNPPTVSSTTPTNGATGVAPTTNITVNFSEPVNATTSSFQIECPTPGNTQPFTLSASPSNTFTLDPTANLPEGVICTVTVVAAQITDQDSGDPPDQMAADYVFSFSIPPRAVDDSRNATGNIRINTDATGFTVLTNDVGPGITVTAFDAASARGGQVTVDTDGTFQYNPPAGYEGPDSFNYTITNAAGSDVGAVNVTVAGMVWFIDDSATACTTNNTTCGRLTNPFSTLAAFEAANGNATPTNNGDVTAPEAGDHVFLYSGNYTGPLTFEANQRFVGQGATSSLLTLLQADGSGFTLAPDSNALPATGGTRPIITGGGFNVVSNDRLFGLHFEDTTSTAVNSNSNVGTLVMADISINNDGTASAGIDIDDGGTSVTITGLNTILTTTGTALEVANTPIGASGLTFRSIASNGGGSPGIVLNNTGTAGGLTVAGNGGTCSTAANCTGGAIVNKTVAGVSLTSASNVSLTRMFLDNNDGSGVIGTSVTGFSIANSVVTNNDNGLADGNQAGLRFTNLHGTSSISSTLFQGQTEDHVRITNDTTGSPNLNLSVTQSTFNINSALTGGHGIAVLGTNTANMTLSVTNSTFDDIRSTAVIMNVANSAKGNYTVSNNSFTDIGAAVTLGTSENADLVFNVTNNATMLRAASNMIQLVAGSNSLPASQIRGTISGNTIGNGTTDSGTISALPVAYGIAVDLRGDQDTIIDILNNTTRNTEWEGVWISAADFGTNSGTNATTDFTIRDNNVLSIDDNDPFPRNDIRGILVDYRHTTNGCMDMASNTSVGSAGFEHIRVRQRDTAIFRIERLTDGDGTPNELITNMATVEAFLAGQNDPGTTVDALATLGFTEAADGACRPVTTPVSAPATFEETTSVEETTPAGGDSQAESGALRMARKEKKAGFVLPVAGEDIWSADGTQLLRAARGEAAPVSLNLPPVKAPRGKTPAAAVESSGDAAPAATAPAPARRLTAAPVVVIGTDADEKQADPADADGADKSDAQPEPGSAAPAAKPAARKSNVKRTETYRPKEGAALPQRDLKDIAYFAPLGAALSGGPRIVRASYAGSGERPEAAKSARTRPAAAKLERTAKATARAAAPALAGETVNVTIGTLPGTKTVKIRFKVTVANPFTDPSQQVSNQGTVSADGISNVLTDDPSVTGANNPTVTPINALSIFARDGKAPEPPTGTAPLLFTIALSTPATGTVTVNYSTADGGATPATGGASCGGSVDYISVTNGSVEFTTGQQVRTVSVDICSDGPAEPDETFLLNLTGTSAGTIDDNQATGTITPAAPAGTTLISELRTFGPGGSNDPNDDFVEIYNNTDSPVTVAASDASAGWGVYTAATCNSAPLLLGTIPNGTVIPARGHFLLTGSAYSLANYGGTGAAAGNLTMAADLPSNANVAVFSTSDITNLSTMTRLDAVGFGSNTGGAICDLLREGTTATPPTTNLTLLGQYSILRDPCGKGGNPNTFGGCPTTGNPQDTNVNASDFFMVDPNGTDAGAGQRIGAAGPENIASPTRRDSVIGIALLDASVAAPTAPNRVRDFTSDPLNNSTFGTLSIRRRFVNNTANPVTRLRFRIVDISTFSSNNADLRARTAPASESVMVNDPATCGAKVPAESHPCTVTLLGTTLEEPPAQPNGGGFNSTLAAGTITTGSPLQPGASINLQFLLGIQQTGNFKFYFIIEALP